MIWLFAAVGLVVLLAVFDRPVRLSSTVLIVVGAILVIGGFSQLAYVEWHYISAGNKPLDIDLPLEKAQTIRLPMTIARDGDYDIWLQFDRTSALYGIGCNDPDYDGEKPCPPRPPELDLRWTVLQDGRPLASDITVPDAHPGLIAPPASTDHHDFGEYARPPANASDQTPRYRFLGTFHALAPGRLQLVLAIHMPAPRIAPRHPRLIIGLSSAETAPVGYTATLFCVLCVLGGGFMLLKGLVPRNASP